MKGDLGTGGKLFITEKLTDVQCMDFIILLVSLTYGVLPSEVVPQERMKKGAGRREGLNKRLALIRHEAIYMCHTVMELSQQVIGNHFKMDRTTIMYAVQKIEDRRGDDKDYDKRLDIMWEGISNILGKNF